MASFEAALIQILHCQFNRQADCAIAIVKCPCAPRKADGRDRRVWICEQM